MDITAVGNVLIHNFICNHPFSLPNSCSSCRLLCVWVGGWVPSIQLRPSQGEGATGLHGRRPRPRGDALPLQLPGLSRRRCSSQVSTEQRLATAQLVRTGQKKITTFLTYETQNNTSSYI